jgi:hypothetical protein
MNEQILPPLAISQYPVDENRLIYIYPPLTCSHCERLTSVALLNSTLPHWFAPRCPLHGYASPYGLNPTVQEQSDARCSIERFAVWMHGDVGRCPLIIEILPEQVPGYELSIDPFTFESLSWHVRYAAPGVEERSDAFVIWSIDINQFSLYEHGQLVSVRSEAL